MDSQKTGNHTGRLHEETWAKTFEEGRIRQKERHFSAGDHEPSLSVENKRGWIQKVATMADFCHLWLRDICERHSYISAISPIGIPTFLGQNPENAFPESFAAGGQAVV